MKMREEPLAVCFSGHRPQKLPGGLLLRMLKSLLYQEIQTAIADGASVFYSGLALGVDLWAADFVIQLRQQNPALRLICANPFPAHGESLRGEARYHQQCVLHAADAVVQVSDAYSPGCYRARNLYMVEHSQRLIAVVETMQSGTGQTIRLAQQRRLDIHLIAMEQVRQLLRQQPTPESVL